MMFDYKKKFDNFQNLSDDEKMYYFAIRENLQSQYHNNAMSFLILCVGGVIISLQFVRLYMYEVAKYSAWCFGIATIIHWLALMILAFKTGQLEKWVTGLVRDGDERRND